MQRVSGRAVVALVLLLALVGGGAFALGRLSARSASPGNAEGQDGSREATPAASAVATGAPAAPAPAGAPLPRVTAPPEKTLLALGTDAYAEGLRIAVVFEPYGTGPDLDGPSVVARVIEATPEGDAKAAPDLAGRNVVFVLGEAKVDAGGRYRGVAVTKRQDDRLVLVLAEVRADTK